MSGKFGRFDPVKAFIGIKSMLGVSGGGVALSEPLPCVAIIGALNDIAVLPVMLLPLDLYP